MAEGDHEGAIKSYTEALRLNPFDPVALNNMGVAKAAAGDYQTAIDFLIRANKRAPNRRDIKENMENLQGWLKAYSGISNAPSMSVNILTPESPQLWSAPTQGETNPKAVKR